MGIQSGSDLDWDQAIKMFSKAIELDPEFTLAYVKRASYYSTVYFTKGDYFSGDWGNFNVLAKADLEKALKIDPELPEVKYEKAEQLYRFDRKHEEALEILNELESQMPNNPSLFSLRSFILRRKGRWEESLNDQQRSIILDPLDANNYNQIGHTYRLMRKYPEAVSFFNKSDARDLKDLIHFDNFFVILEWEGDLNEAAANSALSVFDLGQNPNFRDNYFYYSREFDKLIPTAALFEDQFYYIPRSLNMAQVYFLKSNASLSRLYADSAITELNVRIKSSPYDERYYSSLGFAYAYKGEKKKSIEFALKAVKLKPIELDVWQGYKKEEDLARIYVLTDEYDMAMDKIEYLLTIPGDLSVPLLKIDPAYDKLRQLPRFQKILATEYKTKYQ
jgi:tetratricopeptide (TPR) repeat protein